MEQNGQQNGFIRLVGVTKTFQEGDRTRVVLGELGANISAGEFVAMVGRSGSGKSTLLNLIAGLDVPTGGEIWIADTCVSRLDDRRRTVFRRDHIGFVFQFFNLIATLTVRENVLLTAELANWKADDARSQVDRLLDAVGLLDRAPVFPDRLSGGEQQRVAIARALCADPPVILADEPTGNLDSDTGTQVLDLLTRLVRERHKTLIMVTHSPDVAALADRTLRLEHGRLVAQDMGTREAFRESVWPAPRSVSGSSSLNSR